MNGQSSIPSSEKYCLHETSRISFQDPFSGAMSRKYEESNEVLINWTVTVTGKAHILGSLFVFRGLIKNAY